MLSGFSHSKCSELASNPGLGSRLAQSILPHAGNKGINFRCYEAKKQGKVKKYIYRIVRVGGCPVAVAQWQSTGGSSQRCPGFDSRRLLAFFTFLYFPLCILMYQSTVYTPY